MHLRSAVLASCCALAVGAPAATAALPDGRAYELVSPYDTGQGDVFTARPGFMVNPTSCDPNGILAATRNTCRASRRAGLAFRARNAKRLRRGTQLRVAGC